MDANRIVSRAARWESLGPRWYGWSTGWTSTSMASAWTFQYGRHIDPIVQTPFRCEDRSNLFKLFILIILPKNVRDIILSRIATSMIVGSYVHTRHFEDIISFNSTPNNPTRYRFLSSFLRWGNWGSERDWDFLKVTQQGSDKAIPDWNFCFSQRATLPQDNIWACLLSAKYKALRTNRILH